MAILLLGEALVGQTVAKLARCNCWKGVIVSRGERSVTLYHVQLHDRRVDTWVVTDGESSVDGLISMLVAFTITPDDAGNPAFQIHGLTLWSDLLSLQAMCEVMKKASFPDHPEV